MARFYSDRPDISVETLLQDAGSEGALERFDADNSWERIYPRTGFEPFAAEAAPSMCAALSTLCWVNCAFR